MKTKITSFLSPRCARLTFATSAFADTEEGFYEKDHIRGFISIGADYRGMFVANSSDYVNKVAFMNGSIVTTEGPHGRQTTMPAD